MIIERCKKMVDLMSKYQDHLKKYGAMSNNKEKEEYYTSIKHITALTADLYALTAYNIYLNTRNDYLLKDLEKYVRSRSSSYTYDLDPASPINDIRKRIKENELLPERISKELEEKSII